MRVFALSDIHADYDENKRWISNLSSADYLNDYLIIAGDVTDDCKLLAGIFLNVERKFSKIFFVPGNHELWITRDKLDCSFEKYGLVNQVAENCGINTQPYISDDLCIIPMLSWYDFSFAEPTEYLMQIWRDFSSCAWPSGFNLEKVNQHFLSMNLKHMLPKTQFTISFSHFLPHIGLMPDYIPASKRFLYPVLGSQALGKQVENLEPNFHVYGHTHVNRTVKIGNTTYINNAFGYPSETNIAKKTLQCIYER
jgi:predicted phosphodiesterase